MNFFSLHAAIFVRSGQAFYAAPRFPHIQIIRRADSRTSWHGVRYPYLKNAALKCREHRLRWTWSSCSPPWVLMEREQRSWVHRCLWRGQVRCLHAWFVGGIRTSTEGCKTAMDVSIARYSIIRVCSTQAILVFG